MKNDPEIIELMKTIEQNKKITEQQWGRLTRLAGGEEGTLDGDLVKDLPLHYLPLAPSGMKPNKNN